MANLAVKESASVGSGIDTLNIIRSRKLQEIFIGVTGPSGSGISRTSQIIQKKLSSHDYDVHVIKVSSLIKDFKINSDEYDIPEKKTAQRIKALQKKGNYLRQQISPYFISILICREIVKIRKAKLGDGYINEISNKRMAFIFDSLKNHHEIAFLREVYKSSFYLFGLVCSEAQCKQRLVTKGYIDLDFSEIYKKESGDQSKDYELHVRRCLQESDFFIGNEINQLDALETKITRFIDLVFGTKVHTPSVHESGMYHAYVAGGRSACLSRQVGASIVSESGNLLSTGCNDVPRAKGGLYSEDGKEDLRCYKKGGQCYNDFHKKLLMEGLLTHISPLLKNTGDIEKVEKIIKDSQIKQLIEYSRAVHAEMDAIIKLAYEPSGSTKNATLYSTTFPCHSCARHIVVAGIKKVYFIEPYVKSLANILHDDAIAIDEENEQKVSFLPYEGVSPRRYLSLFSKSGWKNNGIIETPSREMPSDFDRLPFDRIYHMEAKAVKDLDNISI